MRRLLDRLRAYRHWDLGTPPPRWRVALRVDEGEAIETVTRYSDRALREAREVFGEGADLTVERVG
jgi:hypothetical protein